jgi:PA domain
MTRTSIRSFAFAAVLGAAAALPAWSANMILNNVDAAGVGFNDPTPATPVGGNTGVTVGDQRLVAYRKALELWGKTLKSDVTVVVRGSFARLTCTATSATLAQALTLQIFANFPGAPLPGHWYHVALANAIVGEDLTPGPPDVPGPNDPFNDDIQANFNGALGAPDCLAGAAWYYGLDNNAPAGQIDFLDTFMHEVAHGLGFSNFANEATGSTPQNLPDVYMAHTLDLTNRRPWSSFTPAEIVASAIRQGQIVWGGPIVTANQSKVLDEYKGLRAAGALALDMDIGTAGFGAVPTAANFNALLIAAANDGVAAPNGGTTTDGCEPITSDVAGKAALIDRGLCAFTVKAKNAQLAGAAAVIIVNSLNRPADVLGGTDATITIPVVMIGTTEGNTVRAALPEVTGTIFVDPSRRFGAAGGYVRLYAPTVVSLSSSISHFDTVATPNVLMEPFATPDLRSARNVDLTASLMQDIGWKLESLKIGECDTGVPNALPNGELLHTGVEACAAGDPSQYRRCVTRLALDAKAADLLPQFGVLKILRCLRP